MVLVVVLFGLLVAFTSRWTVFEADSLRDNSANRRPLLEEQRIPRGRILASDGRTVLAESFATGSGSRRVFTRRYPEGTVFSHPIGYSFIDRGRSGLERSRNDALTGETSEFATILDEITSAGREGDDVRTTLDPEATRAAIQALGGRKGAVVALEPDTGRVRVMVSLPQFDPNQVPDGFARLVRDNDAPLLNRATQSTYPPGSTMKVVTAVAAIDSGRYTPDSVVSGKSPKEISGVPLSNCCGEGTGNFGPLTLTQALTNSVNTVWAEVAEKLGRDTMVRYMKRFGFYEDPPLDYPDAQLAPSGVFNREGDLVDDGFDVGRVAIGQGGSEGQMRSTPLQMAMVAGAVANRGKLMKPRLTERVVRQDGRVRERVEPEEESEVMKAETADRLKAMMAGVVSQGTATAAQLPGGVAGKTGTAEVEAGENNQVWFIAFAPLEKPRYAIAVTVERTQGQGGTVAAPIAKQVLQSLLRG